MLHKDCYLKNNLSKRESDSYNIGESKNREQYLGNEGVADRGLKACKGNIIICGSNRVLITVL